MAVYLVHTNTLCIVYKSKTLSMWCHLIGASYMIHDVMDVYIFILLPFISCLVVFH